jgi:EmrB/QacA subfamily drug resistance transporter
MSKYGSARSTFLIVGVASFMASLDNLVVTTALPTIRTQFHATLENLEWTVNAYTLTFAAFLLAAAILGDRFGRRSVFVAGIAVFTVGSALAAISTSASMLVVARVIQGTGGSVIFPLGLTLLVQTVSGRRRGAAIAGLSAMSGLAIALGPWIGGAIVQLGDWHWVFWINVPIGVVLTPAALRWLRNSHGPNTRLDLTGTLLVTGGLLGVVYGVIESNNRGWGGPQVLIPVIAGAALLAAFVIWEHRVAVPVVPPRLFRSRGFTLTNLVAMLIQGGTFGSVFLLIQFLQDVQHYSPVGAGLRTLPWTLMPLLVVPLATILASRLGLRWLMVASAVLQGAALGWLAFIVSGTVSYDLILPALVAAGIGMGLYFALNARQMLEFVTTDEEGIASGINASVRQVGVVLGIAVFSRIFAGEGGGYGSGAAFVSGLRPALWAAAGVLAVAVAAAALTPPSPAAAEVSDAGQPSQDDEYLRQADDATQVS